MASDHCQPMFRLTWTSCPGRVAWDGDPDAGDSDPTHPPTIESAANELLAPLLAEFARRRPDEDDTATIVEAGRTALRPTRASSGARASPTSPTRWPWPTIVAELGLDDADRGRRPAARRRGGHRR